MLHIISDHLWRQEKDTIFKHFRLVLASGGKDVGEVDEELKSLYPINRRILKEAGQVTLLKHRNLHFGEIIIEEEADKTFRTACEDDMECEHLQS